MRLRTLGSVPALTLVTSTLALALSAAPASALQADAMRAGESCLVPHEHGPAAAARGGRDGDTRDVSEQEQATIRKDVAARLEDKGVSSAQAANLSASIPVYVHVMRDKNGAGDVTDAQISQQIKVLNTTYAGAESSSAANTGFTFTLAGIDRFNNSTWHRDGASTTYRSQTRKGGANALNIWLVDFDYLGIATFPWDYAKNPKIDGIRVQYSSLPGGSATNYNLGKTAAHEAGHWFGLYHTFQGGCAAPGDEVSDTPAQASPTTGCPAGRDSCTSTGLDPIHNYMDYSYDSCYDQFTPGQSARASQMYAAYRS